jgi:hypothetical protein
LTFMNWTLATQLSTIFIFRIIIQIMSVTNLNFSFILICIYKCIKNEACKSSVFNFFSFNPSFIVCCHCKRTSHVKHIFYAKISVTVKIFNLFNTMVNMHNSHC